MARRVAALLSVAILAFGCSPAPTPAPTAGVAPTPGPTGAPGQTTGPASSQPPAAEGASSQALIAADLAAGTITLPQSLLYRAWTAFGDRRLPERYDGTGSAFEDTGLIDEIAAVLPSLDGAQRAELEPFLLRPTDPKSAWSGGASTAAAGSGYPGLAVAATDPPPILCTAPRRWISRDWSPNGNVDVGFRFWACDYDERQAAPSLDEVVRIGSTLWGPMTRAEPNGLGLPMPDTGIPQSDGNGKTDVYLLDPLAECQVRGAECRPITGAATTVSDHPGHCNINGYPTHACTNYMLLNRLDIGTPDLPGSFAHEFFHVLQASHNDDLRDMWYVEASAVWAEWRYVATSGLFPRSTRASRLDVLSYPAQYLGVGHSLVRHVPYAQDADSLDGYRAVVWPMFEAIEGDQQTIYQTWQALESAVAVGDVDRTIDRLFPFATHFRDFTAWVAQPRPYIFGSSQGLDDIRWQTKPFFGPPDPFPLPSRHEDDYDLQVNIGTSSVPVDIEAADAAYNLFTSIGRSVREIDIDASGVGNAANLDLELLAKMTPRDEDSFDDWRRIPGHGLRLTLCRDHPTEDVELFEMIVSNHAFTRDGSGTQPDPGKQARGDVVITAKDSCDAPTGFTGTFSGTNTIDSWSGTATFKREPPGILTGACEDTGGVYCYDIVSGSATWTVQGVTKTVSLAPPDAAGEIVLIFEDPRHPDRSGTYEIGVSPSTEIFIPLPKGGNRQAFDTVRAWMNAIEYPHFPSDFHLSGSEDSGTGCGIDGCGPTTVWKWDLTATWN